VHYELKEKRDMAAVSENDTRLSSLSIVFPAYNEESNIEKLGLVSQQAGPGGARKRVPPGWRIALVPDKLASVPVMFLSTRGTQTFCQHLVILMILRDYKARKPY
jgi:hypothetical protein